MRLQLVAAVLALATALAGCNNSNDIKTWNCHYSCASPQASGNKSYQDDDEPEAEDKCTADFGGSKCTESFSCDCTQS
ncbi:MAG TPA: hypothetical protein VFN91_02275 [Myxococcaceae bacterium]|nr:hypothetical protein [Myxococcaceae bacterium]